MDGFGTEIGEVLVSVQYAMARDSQRPAASAPWGVRSERVELPTIARELSTKLRTTDEVEAIETIFDRLVDQATGAGSLFALRRDLDVEGSASGSITGTFTLAAAHVHPLASIREKDGDEVAEAIIRSLVEVAPFVLRAKDRLYRTARDELAFLLEEADPAGATAALGRLEGTVQRALSDRHLPAVTLSIRPLDPAEVPDAGFNHGPEGDDELMSPEIMRLMNLALEAAS